MKDPALLWYFSDWFSGTATLTRHHKGAYMDLLSVQFNQGKLTLDEIKTVLGSDFGSTWPTLQKKFKFEDNLYFNERLQQEKDKRANYTESRRKNAKHMPKHMEDIDINKNTNSELPVWLNPDSWNDWISYNLEKKRKLPPTTVKLQLKKLEKLGIANHREVINQSIEKKWTGFFPLPEQGQKQNYKQPPRWIEPSDSKEVNDRKRFLEKQAESLTSGFQVKQ